MFVWSILYQSCTSYKKFVYTIVYNMDIYIYIRRSVVLMLYSEYLKAALYAIHSTHTTQSIVRVSLCEVEVQCVLFAIFYVCTHSG